MGASDKVAATLHGANREQQVLYRDNYQCQANKPGCGIGATHTELTRTLDELAALRRDPTNPDNWWSVCPNCQRTDNGNQET